MNKVYMHLPLEMVGEQNASQPLTVPTSNINITTDADFLAKVEADERDNKFLYAYTDAGISANSRNWTNDIMSSIAQQTIDKLPVGYLGHIKPTDYGFEFPEPQTVWFGSYIETLPSGNNRLWLKGYLLPTATNLETWINTKAVDSISVYGGVSYTESNGVKTITAIDLKSIDISRKLGEGLNSKIVSLAGEMSAVSLVGGIEVHDLKDIISNKVKAKVKSDLALTQPLYYNDGSPKTPYVWCYCEKFYIGTNRLIMEVEIEHGTTTRKLYDVDYELIYDKTQTDVIVDAKVNSLKEVTKVVDYIEITDGDEIVVGEMNKGGLVMDRNQVIASLTLQEIQGNSALFGELKTAIANDMQNAQANQVLMAKAGEMDSICEVLGEQEVGNVTTKIKSILDSRSTFIGEMAKIFVGEQAEGEVTEEQVVEAAQKVVEENNSLNETVKAVAEKVDAVNEDGTVDTAKVVEGVSAIVDANVLAQNTADIQEVQAKFEELAQAVTSEVILEYVKDDFATILGAKAETLPANWKTDSIAHLEAEFETIVTKHTARLGNVVQDAQVAGEMNAMLKVGAGATTKTTAKSEQIDPDVAYLKSLGYNV